VNELHVDRLIAAPPDAVWAAWTTVEGLATWWWTGWDDTTYRVDLRVGGTYRIEAPRAGLSIHGEYLSIDAPHRLEMTWVWTDDDGPGPREHVVVTLDEESGETRVTVMHTGPWSTPEPAERYREGWAHVLDRLAAVSGRTG